MKQKEGITLSYDKDDLNRKCPNMMSEIGEETKKIKIDSVYFDIEKENHGEQAKEVNLIPQELINPGPIDFIRRCSTNEEANQILDYLLKRKEISQEEYKTFKTCIEKEGGLSKLISESGGFKEPGYYLRKYYKGLGLIQKENSKPKKETPINSKE